MKKKWTLLIVFIVSLSLAMVACSKSTGHELFRAFDKTANIDSQESLIEWDFDFMPIAFQDNIAGHIFNKLTKGNAMTLESKEDIKNKKSVSNLTTSFMGLSLNTEIIRVEDSLAIRSPLFKNLMGIGDKYLIRKSQDVDQEDNDVLKILNMDYLTIYNDLNHVLIKTLKSGIKDEKIQLAGTNNLESPEGPIEGKEYRIKIENHEIKPLARRFAINSLKNKNLRNLIFSFIRDNMDEIRKGISQEDLSKNPDKIVDRIIKNLEFEGQIQLSYFLDKDNYIRKSDTKLLVTIINKETKRSEDISINMSYLRWNINGKIELDIPEFTEENSININQINRDKPFINNF